MTTLAARRSALAAAIVAQGVPVPDTWGAQQPPYALIFGDATDLKPSGGSVRWAFRVTGVVAKATDAMAMSAMDAMSWALVTAVWGLPGFRIDGLSSVAMRDIALAMHYTVDLNVSTTVDF